MKKNFVVHRIKSSTDVIEGQEGDLRHVNSTVDISKEVQKKGLSRISLAKTRLTWRKKLISVQISKQLRGN